MSKFYVAKKGRVPGIYPTWALCQAQTSGFSGAIHKSFSNHMDALNFLYDGNIPEIEKMQALAPLAAKNKMAEAGLSTIIATALDDQNKLPTTLLEQVIDQKHGEETEEFYYGVPKMPLVPKCNNYEKYDRSILDTNPLAIMIYVDGSKRPSVNHRGSGAYCRYNHKDFYLSVPFTADVGHRYQFNPADFDKLSSPTMEYLAFSEVLFRFLRFKFPMIIDPITGQSRVRVLNPRIKITFVADYDGVKNFTEGNWIPEKDYIIKINNGCSAIIQFLKERGIDINVLHTPGHQGMLGNELSDIKAKSQIPFDTMVDLIAEISEKVAVEN